MLVFYRDEDGRSPFLDWFDRLPEKAKVQCRARIDLLAVHGHLLRRPAADYLRDDILELRARSGRVQYRMLYFFHGRAAIVISHGITKNQATVPSIEIDRACRRRALFMTDPRRHTYKETP